MVKIDAKNRMSLPAEFRAELQRRSDQPPFLTNAHECLELYPYDDWCDLEERIVRIAAVDPEAQAYVRFMVSGAAPCPIDKQGRIIVPSYLRRHASLVRDVTVAGVGLKIELWESSRLDAHLAIDKGRLPEMAQSVAAKLAM